MNLKDGSFQTSITASSLQRLELNYSSRRNFTGAFGTGWCSILDLEIRKGRGQILELINCDQVTRFQPAKTSALLKSEAQYFEALEDTEQQLELQDRRMNYRHEGRTYRFDDKGQLQSIDDAQGSFYRILGKSPTGLRVQVQGQLLDLEMNAERFVIAVTGLAQSQLKLKYDGAHLSSVEESKVSQLEAPRTLVSYQYDQDGNMTNYQDGRGGPPVFLGYDRPTDRVVTVRGRKECLEKFEYDRPGGPVNGPSAFSPLRLRSRYFIVCKNHEQLISELENDFLKTRSQELILTQSRFLTQERIRTLSFHPLLGTIERESSTANPNSESFKPKARPKARLASE